MNVKDISALLKFFHDETQFSSNPEDGLTTLPGKKLLALNNEFVAYVFKENIFLTPHVMSLLTTIIGIDPVKPTHAGDVHKMNLDWQQWARDNDLL